MTTLTRPPAREYRPADLLAIRSALGISSLQMAAMLGMEGHGDKVRDRYHETETGARPLTGPMSLVLRYLSQAVDSETDSTLADLIGAALPRYLECSDLEDEDGAHLAMHTRWPRFFALEPPPDDPLDSLAIDALRAAGTDIAELPAHIGGGCMIILWIDEPTDEARAARAVAECVRLTVARAESDLAGDFD